MERTTHRAPTLLLMILALSLPAQGDLIYYSAEPIRGFSQLYAYDTLTGDILDQGLLHGMRYTTDLAFSPEGDLFGVAWSGAKANGRAKLFSITLGDESTWAQWSLEKVRSNRMERSVNAAVFDQDGKLFVTSAAGKLQLLTYSPLDDRWEVQKTGSMGKASGGDLAFNGAGDTLYCTLEGGELATLDFDPASPTFGRASVIGSTGYPEVFGLAFLDGLMYGTTNDRTNYGPSDLIQIDPMTGQATGVRDLGFGVWGAASAPPTIAEPTTLAVIILGAATMQYRYVRHVRGR